MMQVTNIASPLFRCATVDSRELKTLYLFDQNNQNNGCQKEINEKYKRYWHSFEIPIGVCLHEYPGQLFVPIGTLRRYSFHFQLCTDIPRTRVEDCRHLSVKICTRGRKRKIAYAPGNDTIIAGHVHTYRT